VQFIGNQQYVKQLQFTTYSTYDKTVSERKHTHHIFSERKDLEQKSIQISHLNHNIERVTLQIF
jgi:hypothetical protein